MPSKIDPDSTTCTITLSNVPIALRDKFKAYCSKHNTNQREFLLAYIEDCLAKDDSRRNAIVKGLRDGIREELLEWKKGYDE